MKHTIKYSLYILVLLSLLLGCRDTRINGVDLDFKAQLTESNITSYIGKPNKIGIDIKLLDDHNNSPMFVTFGYKSGEIKIDGKIIESGKPININHQGTQWFEYTASDFGTSTIDILLENELVDNELYLDIECNKSFFDVALQDVPDRILIDTKADFKLLLSEMETSSEETVETYARILKGKGSVYVGENIINIPEEEEDSEEEGKERSLLIENDSIDSKDISKTSRAIGQPQRTIPLNIGTNNMSYFGTEEGENIIRLHMKNQWGYEITKDVQLIVNLPKWELSNSIGEDAVEIPYKDKYSFNLSVDEADIFKENSYTGVFRIKSNSDIKLFINDREYNQGAEFKLKPGANVGVIIANDATEGAIEFIVKDKYKQESKNEIEFISKLPIKPIEASLDKSSVPVKINQTALFKLSLSEVNYSDVFKVKCELLSGEGTFEGGNEHSLSEGTHDIKFTPTIKGASTFKLTITDSNNQEKILNATVQATLSPLTLSLSETDVELIQGKTKTISLNIKEDDYIGNFKLSYRSTAPDILEVNGQQLGKGGQIEFKDTQALITLSSPKLGSINYTLIVTDDYSQSKEIEFTLTTYGLVTLQAETGGLVSGGGSFKLNQNSTIVAKANLGHKFIGWYKGNTEISTITPFTFPVTESVELTARFSKSDYSVVVENETGGTATGGGNYKHGDITTIKATALEGYEFLGWFSSNSLVSSSLEYKITVTENKSYIAKFQPKSYVITINSSAGGSATGSGTYKYDSKATLKATPDKGYTFSGWFINNKSLSSVGEYSFLIKESLQIEARFTANDYSLTVNSSVGGSATGGGNFKHGDNVKVTATPDANHTFKGWYLGEKEVSASINYNFVITESTTLVAKFSPKKFNLAVLAKEGGTVTGGGAFDYNTKATLKATPSTGFGFRGWYLSDRLISTDAIYEHIVTKNETLEAQFVANKYSISATAEIGGSVSGAKLYDFNSEATLVATPSANYALEGWYEGDTKVSTNTTYTFKVTKERVLVAKFIARKYTLTISPSTGGTATGGNSYTYNTKAKVTASANDGYGFDGWYSGNTKLSSSSTYEHLVTKDETLEARFVANKYNISASVETGGSVSGGKQYSHGETATLIAKADLNYSFSGWFEGETKVSPNATYSFVVSKERALVAKFEGNKFNVTVNAATGGSATGGGNLPFGSKVTATAKADKNYSFTGWYIDNKLVSNSANYEFVVTGNMILEARFTAGKFNVTVNAATGGSATGSGTFDYNSNVVVTATPLANYEFLGWHDGTKIVSTSAAYTFLLKEDIALEARFSPKKYTLSVNAATGGAATGGGNFEYNTKAKLVATAATGHGFDGWYSGNTKLSSSATYEHLVTKDEILEARFKVNKFNISVSAETGGNVSGGKEYDYNSTATLVATPSANFSFEGWYEGNTRVSTNATYTFKVTEDRALVAKFSGNKFNVTANASTGGTATGGGNLAFGSKTTVTAKADENYSFSGWYIDNKLVSNSANYEFVVTGNMILEARFTAGKFNVTVNSGAGGTATGSGAFDYNSNVTVTATPSANYEFSGWHDGTKIVSTSASYSFVLKETISLTANFIGKTYYLTVNAATGGTATGSGTYEYNSKAKITATASTGFVFEGWFSGSTKLSTSITYEHLISKTETIEARFIPNKHSISVSAETGGNVSGGKQYDYGTNATLVATPIANYQFAGWFEGETKVSSNATYSFTVTKDRTLVAKFIGDKFNVTVNAATGGSATGGGNLPFGSKVTATAKADVNYSFGGWYIDNKLVSNSLSYEFVVTGNMILEARFIAKKFNVTVNAETGGSATGGGVFEFNSNVKVTATPDANHTFKGWHDGTKIISTSLSYEFVLKSALTLVAQFEAKKFALSVNASPSTGGSVTGAGTYTYNTKAKLVATPSANYTFDAWYIGNTKISSSATYEHLVTKIETIEARFIGKKYTITASADNGGSATGGKEYSYGENAVLTATPSANYTFLAWFEDNVQVSTSSTYSFKVEKARNLVAKFKGNPFNVTANAATGGSATGSGTYANGSKVKVIATPNANYSFVGWFIDNKEVSKSPTYEFTLTGNTTLEARFAANKVNVVVNSDAGGTATGGGSYQVDTNVKVTATPDANHTFKGWHDGTKIVSTSLTYEFVLKGAITLNAQFEAKNYDVVVNTSEGGTATGGGKFKYNSTASLVATAHSGYKFLGWYENNSQISISNTYAFKVEKDRNIHARFEAITYNIVANAENGGSATGSGTFNHGSNVTLKATPNANHSFIGWFEGTTQVSTNATYTFVATKAVTYIAKFKVNKYKVTLTGVNGTQTGGGDYDWNTNATLKAVPNTNYIFLGWFSGNTKLSESNPYIFNVEKDIIVEAKYQLVTYSISVSAETGGSATGGGNFAHGADVTIKATPQANYQFEGWFEGETKISPNVSYTFKAAKARSLVAKFTLKSYVITATATPSIGGTAIGGKTYNHGDNVSLVATPQTGYRFLGWFEGGAQKSSNLTYSFKAESTRTLEAKFERITYDIATTATEGGTVTGGKTYNHGDNVSLVATPKAGYRFLGWFEGGSLKQANQTYNFTAEKNRTLDAKFEAISYSYTVVTNLSNKEQVTLNSNGGTLKFNEKVNLTAKDGAEMTANAKAYNVWDGWYINGVKQTSSTEFLFTMPASNVELEARYKFPIQKAYIKGYSTNWTREQCPSNSMRNPYVYTDVYLELNFVEVEYVGVGRSTFYMHDIPSPVQGSGSVEFNAYYDICSINGGRNVAWKNTATFTISKGQNVSQTTRFNIERKKFQTIMSAQRNQRITIGGQSFEIEPNDGGSIGTYVSIENR